MATYRIRMRRVRLVAVPEAPVSVIIPTYNRPESCAEAVASVLAQEPAPLEVLVCDNASPAPAAARLLELVEGRPGVRVLRRATNSGGPAAPRNEALRAATAPWVAFLDDDDQWLPG